MKLQDNLFLISGTDEAAIQHKSREIVREIAGENPDAFALDIVSDSDELPAADAVGQVLQSLQSPPFLGDRKTVWLKDFSGFAQEKAGARSGTAAGALEALAKKIEEGIPNDVVCILSGPGIDRRKKLYKACSGTGTVVLIDKPSIRDRDWQGKVRERLREVADAKGLRLPAEFQDYLVEAVGTETARLEQELEKLLVYCEGKPEELTVAEVQAICPSEGETISWRLRDEVGKRNSCGALQVLHDLLEQERDAEGAVIGLVLQIAGHVRDMLQVRILMHRQRLRRPEQVQSALKQMDAGTKSQYADDGIEIVEYHPYRALKVAEQALRFKGAELVADVVRLRDVYRACVSGGSSNRAVFERALIDICNPSQGAGS